MSTMIYIVAQVIISQEHLNRVVMYNSLLEAGFDPPEGLIDSLKSSLGENACAEWGEYKITIEKQDVGTLAEYCVKSKGNAFYDGGMIVNMTDLPQDTVSLKICTSS